MKCTFAGGLVLAVAAVVWADSQDGEQAYARGDYVTAYREYLPLAQQGNVKAQHQLGVMYFHGQGVPRNPAEAMAWYRRAADQGIALAQDNLGLMYESGQGTPQNFQEAVNWYRRAAEQGIGVAQADAQFRLGVMHAIGRGLVQNYSEALIWYRRAADQGHAMAQHNLGVMYANGQGIAQDLVVAYRWYSLSAARGSGVPQQAAVSQRDALALKLSPAQLAKAQQLASDWKPIESAATPSPATAAALPAPAPTEPRSSGSGFVVSRRGDVLTSAHVVQDCREVRIGFGSKPGTVAAVVATDRQNDLAVLAGATPTTSAATFREGRGLKQGDTVLAVGFPLRGLLASQTSPTVGTVSGLAGPRDDTRYLQITAPVQSGNSGGPLLDQSGHLVGVIVSQLDALQVAQQTGNIPQNVNFAIHASVARTFLDAHGVEYETAPSVKMLQAWEVGDRAKTYTLAIECWR